MKVGDTAYIVESNRYVREVEIRRCSGKLAVVAFLDAWEKQIGSIERVLL